MQEDLKNQLTSRYNREADAYRELWAPVLLVSGRKLLRQFADLPIARALDVGAGVGVLLPEIQNTFPDATVFSCDRSPGMMSMAPAGYNRSIMDANQLAIATKSVDLVTMVFMLFHLQNPIDGLKEARRALRDGGQIGLVTWAEQRDSDAEVIWAECLDAHGAAPTDTLSQSRHDLVDTTDKMEALLTDAGFTNVRSWTEDLHCADNLDHFIRTKTSMGHNKPRYDSLTPTTQLACIAEARKRLDTPDAPFESVSQIVYSTATVG